MMYKLYRFLKVDFWLTVRMHMRNYGKFDHTQTTYLWFLILLYIQKTDSEVKIQVNLDAYSTTPSARSKNKNILLSVFLSNFKLFCYLDFPFLYIHENFVEKFMKTKIMYLSDFFEQFQAILFLGFLVLIFLKNLWKQKILCLEQFKVYF